MCVASNPQQPPLKDFENVSFREINIPGKLWSGISSWLLDSKDKPFTSNYYPLD